MSDFLCRFCGRPVWFDPKRRTPEGKGIPLDVGTHAGHDCQFYAEIPTKWDVSYRSQQPYSYYFPCKFCGCEIYFSKSLRAKASHKPIPIERRTKQPHTCPARHYTSEKKLSS